MGSKQLNRPACHGPASWGEVWLRTSEGLASTSLTRIFQSSTSALSMGPAAATWLFWGAAIAGSCCVVLWDEAKVLRASAGENYNI